MMDTILTNNARSPGRRSPKRVGSKTPPREKRSKSKLRTPLQEKSSSESNQAAGQVGKEKSLESNPYATTPFPTKPQHILLPSTIRKQNNSQTFENNLLIPERSDGIWRPESAHGARPDTANSRKAPVLQLKRSVTTLRDMYEAQEKSSRPSTATSPILRPTTSSSRLRSASSSEGMSGRYAWERLHQISSDDLALLPSLNETMLQKMDSEQSFASRMKAPLPLTSSPNFQIYSSSSSRIPVFRDGPSSPSELVEPSSSTGMADTISSSPNFVRLGRSSSVGETESTLQSSSSPNFIKLGTSSPGRRDSSPTPSSGSAKSLKRKRGDVGGNSSQNVQRRLFDSTPPYEMPAASSSDPSIQSQGGPLPSSPPEIINTAYMSSSSPVFRMPGLIRQRSDTGSSSSAHSNLQAALSSSPVAPIQYPVVRAPSVIGQTLTIPKRNRSSETNNAPFASRLSPVPSEWEDSFDDARIIEENEEELNNFAFSQVDVSANDSQVHIIAEDDNHEASDELSALPRAYKGKSPPIVPTRTNSLYGTLSSSSATQPQPRLNSLRLSMDSRLNSMKSHSRHNSFMSGSLRPSSSSSGMTTVAVPTWARRYYSGVYRDSFQYLYPPSQNGSVNQISLAPPPTSAFRRSNSYQTTSGRASTQTTRSSRHSFQSLRHSIRDSLAERLPSIVRPRLEARKSHLTMGIGPLVSNPVRPESLPLDSESFRQPKTTIRQVSGSLPSVDPRAHWAGVDETTIQAPASIYHDASSYSGRQQQGHMTSSDSDSIYYDTADPYDRIPSRFCFLPSPHLHHDRRLNTGSSKSRGYGYPFNQKSLFAPPSIYENGRSRLINLRRTQKICFILGFVCPPSWFIAAILPLPTRPVEYSDVEKAEWDDATQGGRRPLVDYEEMDVVARLRMERHERGLEELRWQNARWWRRMNRVMSVVGVVVLILIIVLAVVGTRNRW